MRKFIDLVEEYSALSLFWYHPVTKKMRQFGEYETDHAAIASSEIFNWEDDFVPDESKTDDENNFLWNSHYIDKAIKQGWVRGRYEKHELSLQGRRRNVQKTARDFMTDNPVDVLYVDFAEGSDRGRDLDPRKNIALRGARLEFFLSKGSIPSSMISETIVYRDRVHGRVVAVNPTKVEFWSQNFTKGKPQPSAAGIMMNDGSLIVGEGSSFDHVSIMECAGVDPANEAYRLQIYKGKVHVELWLPEGPEGINSDATDEEKIAFAEQHEGKSISDIKSIVGKRLGRIVPGWPVTVLLWTEFQDSIEV